MSLHGHPAAQILIFVISHFQYMDMCANVLCYGSTWWSWSLWTQTEVLTKDSDNECIPSKCSKSMRQGFSILLRESRTHLWTTSVTGFIKGWESTYSGSEDLWQRGFILEKVSQDLGQEAPARTQVYLSKMKLRNTSYLYTKSTVEMMTS